MNSDTQYYLSYKVQTGKYFQNPKPNNKSATLLKLHRTMVIRDVAWLQLIL